MEEVGMGEKAAGERAGEETVKEGVAAGLGRILCMENTHKVFGGASL